MHNFFFKNVLKLLPFVSIHLLISIKTTKPHEGSFKVLKKLEILVENFFVCRFFRLLVHVCNTKVKKRALRDTFFRNHEPNRVPETSLSSLQNMFWFPSAKYKLSIRSFLEYCYIIVLRRTILRAPQRVFGAW